MLTRRLISRGVFRVFSLDLIIFFHGLVSAKRVPKFGISSLLYFLGTSRRPFWGSLFVHVGHDDFLSLLGCRLACKYSFGAIGLGLSPLTSSDLSQDLFRCVGHKHLISFIDQCVHHTSGWSQVFRLDLIIFHGIVLATRVPKFGISPLSIFFFRMHVGDSLWSLFMYVGHSFSC